MISTRNTFTDSDSDRTFQLCNYRGAAEAVAPSRAQQARGRKIPSPKIFTEFTEAAKVHSNDDGISRHRLAPFNA